MSKPVASKHKSKKYFIRKSFSRKQYLEVGQRGFLCSCNNREKDCIKESYNLLNEFADKLHPPNQPGPAADQQAGNEDIGDSLTTEIEDLKQNTSTQKRFQVVESGAKNFLFIRTTLDDPLELADAIVKDIHDSGTQRTKFLLRLVPIEVTCKANMGEIGKAFDELCRRHFSQEALTFSVIFHHRNNNAISRDDVIKLIADKVLAVRDDHKVDLKEAQISVIVEIVKGFAFLSVIRNYLKYKKFNLLAISRKEQQGQGCGVSDGTQNDGDTA